MNNKRIHDHGLKIIGFFVCVSKETKFNVDTTSINLSYLYHFKNVTA